MAGLPVNHHYFSYIDSEEKAYWLGFLMADGCVSRDRITVELKDTDRAQIEAFRSAIGSAHKIGSHTRKKGGFKEGTKTATFEFCSKQMIVDLAKCNIVPRKSLTAIPWDGPPELMKHYWRGAIDGDGWVTTGEQPIIGLIGSQAVVEAFRQFVVSITNTETKMAQNGLVWQFQISSLPAQTVMRELYEGATVFLARKKLNADIVLARKLEPRWTIRKQWSSLTREIILESFARHGSWPKVAKELGVELNTLRNFAIRRFGITTADTDPFRKESWNSHKNKNWSAISRDQLLELFCQHKDWSKVAKSLDVSLGTLYKYLKNRYYIEYKGDGIWE